MIFIYPVLLSSVNFFLFNPGANLNSPLFSKIIIADCSGTD
jgi:hypothetical protein